MASTYTVLPGLKGHEIAGKIENGCVYICLTDMAQDAGKSLHEYGYLETTKDYINNLALQERVPRHEYYQIINDEAPESLARHFGKWLDPRYDAVVYLLRLNLHRVQEGRKLSKFKVSFAAHRQRDVQKAQSEVFNRWVNRQGNGEFSQLNNDVLLAKTGRTAAQWQEAGAAIDPPVSSNASAPEIIFRIDPELAAELSLMKCLMVQEDVSLEEANRCSHEMRLAFQQDDSAA
jgi:hypothetical protein